MEDGPVDARTYHERTKHTPESVHKSGVQLDFENKPRLRKVYRNVDRHPLATFAEPSMPTLDAIATRPETPRVPSLETIAACMYYAAGITKEIEVRGRTLPFRAAACTGALYHIDCYLVTRSFEGLPAGVYHFDPHSEGLDVLRTGDYRAVLAEASADPAIETAPVTVITTSTWWRNAWKYGDRTFRHAFWDSGTVVANLLATARAFDHRARTILGFVDETIVDLLGIDPRDEAPLQLVPIGGDAPGSDPDPDPDPDPDSDPDRVPASGSITPIELVTEPLSPDPREQPLISRAWTAGTLSGAETVESWRAHAAPIPSPPIRMENEIPLRPVGPGRASARPLDRTIVRRGSCRHYSRDSISYRAFSTVLDRAVRGLSLDVRESADPPLAYTDLYLIIAAVDGLEPGRYRFDAIDRQLERIESEPVRQTAGHLALDQQLGADAAANIYFLADLDALEDRLGDRGYRVAQFEAAATAGRLYLATYAHRRLGGTGLTFYDDLVAEYLAPETGQQPMFLYTIGRPA